MSIFLAQGIIYAMALPERYDIACGAYAFALVVTQRSAASIRLPCWPRSWETLIGRALGLVAAMLVAALLSRAGKSLGDCLSSS